MKKITFLLVIGIIIGFMSCRDQDEIYKKYLVPNGLTYPEQVKYFLVRPGNERIEFLWLRGIDPKVVKAKIFWNNYTDSTEIAIPPNQEVISAIINNIPENTYSFMIHTYDAEGNISIPVEVIGRVYGPVYQSTLTNRVLMGSLYDGLDLILNWYVAEDTEVGISINYTDITGNQRVMMVDPSEMETTVPNFDPAYPLFYSTVFSPDSLAIDVFNAAQIETTIDPVVQLPKNTWTQFSLPGDIGEVNASLIMPNIWDGNTTGNGFHTVENQPLPCMFTWDMGFMAKLTRMKVWPRDNADDIWRRGHPRVFEIYGSLDPNPDGSLDGSWELLGHFEIVNPNPQIAEPWGDASMVAIARAGFEFEFVPLASLMTSPSCRYIRFYAISNFRGASEEQTTPISITEITFWGRLVR